MRRCRRVVEGLKCEPFLIGRLERAAKAIGVEPRGLVVAPELRVDGLHESRHLYTLDLLGGEMLAECLALQFVRLRSIVAALPAPLRALIGTPRRRQRGDRHQDRGRGLEPWLLRLRIAGRINGGGWRVRGIHLAS